MSGILIESVCPDLKLLARGKVRDIYHVEEGKLLFVATDRLSAFDVVMENVSPRDYSHDRKYLLMRWLGDPGKGKDSHSAQPFLVRAA